MLLEGEEVREMHDCVRELRICSLQWCLGLDRCGGRTRRVEGMFATDESGCIRRHKDLRLTPIITRGFRISTLYIPLPQGGAQTAASDRSLVA
jgi:hypothetical protein